jgi:mannonate dehydratase
MSAIIDTCQECDVKMAIHPDDPPYSVLVYQES